MSIPLEHPGPPASAFPPPTATNSYPFHIPSITQPFEQQTRNSACGSTARSTAISIRAKQPATPSRVSACLSTPNYTPPHA